MATSILLLILLLLPSWSRAACADGNGRFVQLGTKWLYESGIKKKWSEVSAECNAFGATPATFETQAEFDAIKGRPGKCGRHFDPYKGVNLTIYIIYIYIYIPT